MKLRNKSVLLDKPAVFSIGAFTGFNAGDEKEAIFDFEYVEFACAGESFEEMEVTLKGFDYEFALDSNECNDEFLDIIKEAQETGSEKKLVEYLGSLELYEVFYENFLEHKEKVHKSLKIEYMQFSSFEANNTYCDANISNEAIAKYEEAMEKESDIEFTRPLDKEDDGIYMTIKASVPNRELPSIGDILDNIEYLQSNGYTLDSHETKGNNESCELYFSKVS